MTIMRSPIVAMLWENWRLTRVEAGQRLAFGIVGGSAALTWFDRGATYAFWVLLSQYAMFYMSIAKLNGGRFLDGYKPGFPLHLLYTRPVPTSVFVGVAMAYDAFSAAAMYLVSAALLQFAFGQPLPMLSVAVWIAAFHPISTFVQWSTRSRVLQYLGSFGICLPFFLLLIGGTQSALQVEFSLVETALMASIGLASFGLTVAGVARQRRGDAEAKAPTLAGSGAYPDWLVGLFRFPCPTASATRAQVWIELKTSGLPVLAIGGAIAIATAILFALGIPVAALRPVAVACAIFSVPALLILGSGNAFGIRRTQGRTYASAFHASQPHSTAGLAGLKILVRSVCVLAALVVVAVSAWGSSSLISEWHYAAGETVFAGPSDSRTDGTRWVTGMVRARSTFGSAVGELPGYQLAALVVVTFMAIAVMVTLQASRAALWARYPRRLLAAGSVLLFYVLALVLLGLLENGVETVNAILKATLWVATAAIALATASLLATSVAERLLTLRQACGLIVVAAAFGSAWLTLLRAAGVPLATMPAAETVLLSLPVLLTLTVGVLAPWSLSRIRHT
jgi:hypothetical protein